MSRDIENYCKLCDCKVNFTDPLSKKQHINGKKHQGKLIKETGNQIQSKTFTDVIYSIKSKKEERVKKKEDNEKYIIFDNIISKHVIRLLKNNKDESLFISIKEMLNSKDAIIALNMFDNPRFNTILNENEHIIDIICAIFNNNNLSTNDAFDIFYNHETMKIYFTDLICILFNIPFSVKHKIYKLPRNYEIKIFVQLFRRYKNKRDTNINTVCAKIEQIYKYSRIEHAIKKGDTNYAQFMINENNDERASFLEDTFVEARNSWNSKIVHEA